jgi:hypothetical protein
MLPVATEVVLGQFEKRMKAVSAALNAADLPEKVFLDHLLDPVAAFGGVDAVERLLGANKQGTYGFYVNN